jgi:NAD(P)-dependent dehydrogenase (short-subunit alcohol dehydrogenase family)
LPRARAWHSAIGTASAAIAWRPSSRPPGAKVAFTKADVGTEVACLAFVNGAAQKFGRLDILVNNAGIRKYEKVDEANAASWNEILNVSLMSYVFCAKAAVPLMRRDKGGAIVNVASVRSVVAGGGNLQYDKWCESYGSHPFLLRRARESGHPGQPPPGSSAPWAPAFAGATRKIGPGITVPFAPLDH